MSVEYKIKTFNRSTGSILVDFVGLGVYNIDLPISEENKYPEGEELNSFILQYAPTWVLERKQKLEAGVINADAIEALAEVQPEVCLTPDPELDAQQVAFIKTLINQVLDERQDTV